MLKLKQKEKGNIDDVIEKTSKESASLTLKELDIKLGGSGTGSKISQILKQAKGEGEKDCPTCGKGHIHHENGTTKCSNGECATEFVHVPKIRNEKTQYMCTVCHAPHRMPISKELQESDSCPQCGGTDFKRFDWSKIGIENNIK